MAGQAGAGIRHEAHRKLTWTHASNGILSMLRDALLGFLFA